MNMKIEKIKMSTKRRKNFYYDKYEETNKYIYATRRMKIFYIKSFETIRRKNFYYDKYEETWDFYIHEDTFERNFIFGWTFFFLHVICIIILGTIEVFYGINYVYDDLCDLDEYKFLYDFENNWKIEIFNNSEILTYKNITFPFILLLGFSIIFLIFIIII
jgi:hypothetical protein